MSINDRALEWILGRHVGISSKTIWSVMMNVPVDEAGYPHDPDDFERCHRLLEMVPEWRERLPEVAKVYPEWAGLVREWDALTALYNEERRKQSAPKLYDLMQRLILEAGS